MADGTPRHPISPSDAGLTGPEYNVELVDQPLTESGNPFLDAVYEHPAFFVEGYENREGFLTVRNDSIIPPCRIWEIEPWTIQPNYIASFEPKTENSGSGFVNVTEEHVGGHFGHGLPKLFQGHNSLRLAVQTLGFVDRHTLEFGRLVAASRLEFTSIAKPGDYLRFDAEMLENKDGQITGKVRGVNTSKSDQQTMNVEELTVDTSLNREGEGMPPNRILEGALQAAGIAAFEDMDPELFLDEEGKPKVLPLFKSVDHLRFEPVIVNAGDRLIYVPSLSQRPELTQKRQTGRLTADIAIFRQIEQEREPIGQITGARAPVVPAKFVFGR